MTQTKPCWFAQFSHGSGKNRVTYFIDLATVECPVSAITPQSMDLIEAVSAARTVHKASGGVFYGVDSAQWPCRYFDAVEVMHEMDAEREDSFRKAMEAKT